MTNPKILLPIIRKHMPTLIAQNIVGVQPMNLTLPRYQIVSDSNTPVPNGYIKIDVRKEISDWIEQQPIYMWKHGEPGVMVGFYNRYIISEELLSWLILRWA